MKRAALVAVEVPLAVDRRDAETRRRILLLVDQLLEMVGPMEIEIPTPFGAAAVPAGMVLGPFRPTVVAAIGKLEHDKLALVRKYAADLAQ